MSRDDYHASVEKAEQMIAKMGDIIHELLSELITVFQVKKQINLDDVDALLAKEAKLDDLEFKVEKLCTEIIALQQPLAIDLRNIMSVIKISMDLERIGDHLRKIIRKTRKVAENKEFTHFTSLAEMTILLRQMVEQILVAFKENNVQLAKDTLKIDEKINELQRHLFQQFIERIVQDPQEKVISCEIHLLFITRFLERIGDHVENIGERVIYKVTGDFKQLKGQSYS